MPMEPASSHPARWILISVLVLIVAAGVGITCYFGKRPAPLASPPATIRPWAEADFLRLTKPVRSSGKPADPLYTASNGDAVPATDPNCKVISIKSAAAEFVPAYEMIECAAADGFTDGSGGGKIRWLAAKAYDPKLDRDRVPGTSILAPFRADGKPLGEDEAQAMGITRQGLVRHSRAYLRNP